MADPFDALRLPAVPMSPDPAFAADLRRRLERAANLPKGVAVSDVHVDQPAVSSPAEVEDFPRPGAMPYLSIRNARGAIAWYIEVFDAVPVSEPIIMPDDRVGHADLALGGGTIYLADEYPEYGLMGPADGHASVSLQLRVDDCDATLERARAAGATVAAEPSVQYGGRNASLVDPFGHRWMLFQPLPSDQITEAATESEDSDDGADPIRDGDIAYASWWTEDSDLAVLFYSEVLGWEFEPAEPGRDRLVSNVSTRLGLGGGNTRTTLFCCYAVTDIAAATAEVRRMGGTAQEPVDNGNRVTADCVDNQGLAFALYQAQPGDARPPINGSAAGDLTYVTTEVPDSAAYRDFYAAVLGWRFAGGRVADGWETVDAAPMSGLAGGAAAAVVVPMWTVDDVDAAVARVEAAGGRVIEPPSRQSYGVMAQCVDNQGGRFYLGSV